ncbi:hypothetical protein [Ekhidna sp.]|uniref:hypothetical protein n=1 Tax=Ekhidna sp. TaxID=2608089 RepID=UPI003B502FA0
MRTYLSMILLFTTLTSFSQSYVDSGIRHFNVGEYNEALVDFEKAVELKDMLTEAAKGKLYFYRALVWLEKARKAGNAEQDHLNLAYADLSIAATKGKSLEVEVNQAFKELNALLIEEADALLKQEKKADQVLLKLSILDKRIEYLTIIKELGISSFTDLNLGETNKLAGDIIFESTTNVLEMQKAKAYYEEALKSYELARYDDPFSKEIISNLLTLAERLMDVDRVEEYQKLMDLAEE